MRVNTLLAMLMLAFVALSGCTSDDGGDEPHEDDCDHHEGAEHDACHDGDHSHGDGNMTDGGSTGDDNVTAEPNMLPKVFLTATDADGNMLNESSYVLAGSMVTFSSNGTMDEDGEIDIAALTVIDRNQSRTVDLAPGDSVTILADAAGPLLASYRVLDAEGGSNSSTILTYVNEVQVLTYDFDNGAPAGVSGDDCVGAYGDATSSSGQLLDNTYSSEERIDLRNGTRWVEAWVASGSVELGICDDSGSSISEGGSHVWTEEFDVPNSVNYYVYIVCKSASGCSGEVHAINHWEGLPAEVPAKP